MSNPGISTAQMTPELMQQWQALQDQQRRQAMAQALMGNQAQGQNSGIANAGSAIAGALADRNIANNARWTAQGISPVQVTPQVGTTGLGRAANWAKGLFGMGGS
jgi:hypothetical protein